MRTIMLSADLEIRVERQAEYGAEPRIDARIFRRVSDPNARDAWSRFGGFSLSLGEARDLGAALLEEARAAAESSLWSAR